MCWPPTSSPWTTFSKISEKRCGPAGALCCRSKYPFPFVLCCSFSSWILDFYYYFVIFLGVVVVGRCWPKLVRHRRRSWLISIFHTVAAFNEKALAEANCIGIQETVLSLIILASFEHKRGSSSSSSICSSCYQPQPPLRPIAKAPGERSLLREVL